MIVQCIQYVHITCIVYILTLSISITRIYLIILTKICTEQYSCRNIHSIHNIYYVCIQIIVQIIYVNI